MFIAEFSVNPISPDQLRNELDKRRLLGELSGMAINQALQSHSDTVRDSGRPYVEEHTFPVTFEVIRYLGDYLRLPQHQVRNAAVASILHDAPEDDPRFTLEECEERFGSNVSQLVYPLTRIGKVKDIYIKKLQNANGLVKSIKMADRCNNLLSSVQIADTHPKKLRDYTAETEREYLPIARLLSMDIGDNSYVHRLGRVIEIAKIAAGALTEPDSVPV